MISAIQQTQHFQSENGRQKIKDLDELHATFIRNVSHELRTPLCILQGYAELLHNGDLGNLAPQQQQALNVIVARVHDLRTLVERIGILLATQARATVSLPLSLAEVAAKVVDARRSAALEAGLTLEMCLEPHLPLLIGDPYQLEPAIDCLLENAIKFTPNGGRVELHIYSEPGWICLAVTDTGIGMAKEEMECIFDPFCQLDGSSTRRYGGLGLGLGLVKAVVEGHDGKIEVSSQPGHGSNFTVKLPTMPVGTTLQRKDMDDATPRRILIVDDETNLVLTVQDGLERLPNCEVSTATSGQEALHLFEQDPFDLLITDYKMPGTDGMTLATHIRQAYPQTAIVMITAYSSQLLLKQATDISIHRVLDKPVKLDEIRTVALEALENEVKAIT